ncbi:MAG: type IV secretion system DotC family protein [Gammaproteobacteria bacterium]|nr:type IV secretion system DotC family protein [Gammaproteobacteria bacterium]
MLKSYRIKRGIAAILVVGTFLITGCALNREHGKVHYTNLRALESLTKHSKSSAAASNGIRIQALKDTALSIGAQGGLTWQARRLNKAVLEHQSQLDQLFNFTHLMIEGKVQPPVLVKATKSLKLDNATTIRLSNSVYFIAQQARFITTPLNWRQYLLLHFHNPTIPDSTLLPRDHHERVIWKAYVRKGWNNGVRQANHIYRDNLVRLRRDYDGMLLYRQLLARNIVSQPYVAQTNLGVTSNKDRSKLYVNDRVLRITALPQLNPNSATWKPLLETENQSHGAPSR